MMPRAPTYALALAAGLAVDLAASPAAAEVHAVLVGVSDYLVLDADLKGPSNDARLMAETLAARGVDPAAMTVLASDTAGLPAGVATGAPTRAGILAALADIAAKAQPGDTVVFYFSGHGAQAPDMSGDEGGGHDEIFLPADAAGWKGAIGAVENAILDDELNAWAQALLDRDVQLIGLIDACHSATGFRALGARGNPKVLDEAALGIPSDAAPAPFVAETDLTGDYVFLYSSQTDERSFEYPLGDTDLWHGEFTLRLSQVLREAPDASWAQVLAAAADAMVQGPARQVPEGEGPLLDAAVFGTGAGGARLRIEDGRLLAGLLDGIAAGTELALYAEGAGGAPLGTVTVASADPRSAALAGPLPEGAAWAEVSAAPRPDPLVLAAPVRADAADGFDYSAWQAALPAPGARPDIVPILVDGTLALAGPDGVLDPDGPGSTPRVTPQPGETEAEALTRALDTAAHGLALRETLAGASGKSLTGKAVIEVSYERRPGTVQGDACAEGAGPAAAWDPATGAAACDEIWVFVTNTSSKYQDVSLLYQAADLSVWPIWPRRNLSNRLEPGETRRIRMQLSADSVGGTAEIWVLAVPVDKDIGTRVDLTRLASPDRTRDLGDGTDDMALWLDSRMASDDEEEQSRGFSLKPAALTMVRQAVKLKPGSP